MKSVDPSTGALLHEFAPHSPAEASACLDRAALAWPGWAARDFASRATVLHAMSRELRRNQTDLARLAAREMGKPVAQAMAEVEKCAWVCEWYAENAERLLADEPAPTDATRSYTRCEPLGVLLAVMPWNFPFWQVLRAAAPALMAGNVVALKHASNVPSVALAIEALWQDAGAPEGVFTTLLVPSSEVAALIRHDAVAAVLARVQNNGQSCIAAKRFIVEEPVATAFEAAMTVRMRALRVGDPLDDSNQLGPLARPDLVDDLDSQVRRSITAGAKLACGGTRIAGPGNWYAPTVLTHVRPGMAAFDEETFGPLAAITRAQDTADAIALANHTRFGLGASIWTGDAARGEQLARQIRAGAVFVNGIVKSDPRLPFGGIRCSGYGRELAGAGIREFVNLKTVWVREAR